jgi:hypothetical protein
MILRSVVFGVLLLVVACGKKSGDAVPADAGASSEALDPSASAGFHHRPHEHEEHDGGEHHREHREP